jgi:7-cyano-7-deazaguanine synthase
METTQKRAVVLLSGGLDSATVLAIAKAEGYVLYALSFSYGQRHAWELEAAKRVAASVGVAQHRIANIDLRAFGGSALTDNIDVPKGRDAEEMAHGIPITYVPARNTIFLAFALAWAEVLGASDIFLRIAGLNSLKPLRRWPTSRRKPVSRGPVSKAASISAFTRRSST